MTPLLIYPSPAHVYNPDRENSAQISYELNPDVGLSIIQLEML